jgi:hypothetical protein
LYFNWLVPGEIVQHRVVPSHIASEHPSNAHVCALIAAQDGNLGLVQLVRDSFVTRRIQRLTTVYLTLSLADIAAQVGLPGADEAEYHIRR